MNHPARSGKRHGTARPAARRPRAVLVSALLVLGIPLMAAGGGGDGAQAANAGVGVLLFQDDSDYSWAEVELGPDPAALCATVSACARLQMPLNYSMSQYGAFVTGIGGLEAPSDFSWWWEVLLWNDSAPAWQEAPVGASDLRLAPGDSICWCPNSSAPPAPNPLTRYTWPQFRGNSRNTGLSPAPAPSTANVLWTADLGNGPVDSTLAVADGRVLVSTGGLYNWTTMSYENPPHLYSLDAASGRVLWSAETTAAGWQVSSPAVMGGRVYLGTSDGKVMAFSQNKGELLWTFLTGASATGVTSSPLATQNAIFIPSGDGKLYALAPDGREIWNFTLGGPSYLTSPALADGKLLAGSDGGTLWCLALNGTPLWSFSAEGKIRTSPAVSGHRVYFISTEYDGWTAVQSHLYSLDIGTGQRNFDSDWSMNSSTSSPALVGDTIYISTNTNVMSIQASGNGLWDIETGAPVQASLATDGKYVYFGENGQNGTVRALHARTGSEAWRFTPKPRQYLLCSPALSDGRLYFGSDNGKVYCLGDTTVKEAEADGARSQRFPGELAIVAVLVVLLLVAAALIIPQGPVAREGRSDEEE